MPWEKIAQGSAMVLGKFVTTSSSSWWLALDLIPSVIDKKEVGLRDGSAPCLTRVWRFPPASKITDRIFICVIYLARKSSDT